MKNLIKLTKFAKKQVVNLTIGDCFEFALRQILAMTMELFCKFKFSHLITRKPCQI